MEVVTAVSEASANAVEHAYGPAGGLILITASVEGGIVDVRIQDSGTWRTSSRAGGLGKGLQVMRTLMDEVDIVSSAHGNVVTMRRKTA